MRIQWTERAKRIAEKNKIDPYEIESNLRHCEEYGVTDYDFIREIATFFYNAIGEIDVK